MLFLPPYKIKTGIGAHDTYTITSATYKMLLPSTLTTVYTYLARATNDFCNNSINGKLLSLHCNKMIHKQQLNPYFSFGAHVKLSIYLNIKWLNLKQMTILQTKAVC